MRMASRGCPPPRRTVFAAAQGTGIIAPAAPRLHLGFTQDDEYVARRVLEDGGLRPGERFIVLAPTTTWLTKNWPADRYAAMGDAVARRRGCRIVVTGAAGEREQIQAVAAQMTSRPLVTAGELTFRQTAALLNRVSLLVSGDTGPMHAAAALGTPQVALFSPTSPAWYGPWAAPGRALALAHPVPCGPCDQKTCPNMGDDHLRCLRLLGVDDVLAAVWQLLDNPAQRIRETA